MNAISGGTCLGMIGQASLFLVARPQRHRLEDLFQADNDPNRGLALAQLRLVLDVHQLVLDQ